MGELNSSVVKVDGLEVIKISRGWDDLKDTDTLKDGDKLVVKVGKEMKKYILKVKEVIKEEPGEEIVANFEIESTKTVHPVVGDYSIKPTYYGEIGRLAKLKLAITNSTTVKEFLSHIVLKDNSNKLYVMTKNETDIAKAKDDEDTLDKNDRLHIVAQNGKSKVYHIVVEVPPIYFGKDYKIDEGRMTISSDEKKLTTNTTWEEFKENLKFRDGFKVEIERYDESMGMELPLEDTEDYENGNHKLKEGDTLIASGTGAVGGKRYVYTLIFELSLKNILIILNSLVTLPNPQSF